MKLGFFANPITFLALPFGIVCVTGSAFGRKALAWLWIGLTALFIIYLPLKLLPGFNQANWPIIALFLPVHLSMAYGAVFGVIKPQRE